jgi:hypothetical protein
VPGRARRSAVEQHGAEQELRLGVALLGKRRKRGARLAPLAGVIELLALREIRGESRRREQREDQCEPHVSP